MAEAHGEDKINRSSRILASKDVDAVTSIETTVGDAKLGSAVSRTRNKKSKLNETEKKQSKGKNEKDKLLVLLFQEKLQAQLLPNQKSLLLAKVARVLHKFQQASHC